MSLQLLALILGGIVDPVDAARAEVLERVVTQDDANQVAAEKIEEKVVPPALVEVGEPVAESDLADFEANRACPGNIPVAHDEELTPPAQEVGDKMNIKNSIAKVCAWGGWVLWSEETAVFAIAALRQGSAQVVVEDAKRVPCLIDG